MPKSAKKTTKSKAKGSKREYASSDRPLNNYNLFYYLERELLLQRTRVPSFDASSTAPPSQNFHHYKDLAKQLPQRPERYRHLCIPDDWFLKKKKTKNKPHGEITFLDLTRSIADSWRTVDQDIKDYVTTVSKLVKSRRDVIRLLDDTQGDELCKVKPDDNLVDESQGRWLDSTVLEATGKHNKPGYIHIMVPPSDPMEIYGVKASSHGCINECKHDDKVYGDASSSSARRCSLSPLSLNDGVSSLGADKANEPSTFTQAKTEFNDFGNSSVCQAVHRESIISPESNSLSMLTHQLNDAREWAADLFDQTNYQPVKRDSQSTPTNQKICNDDEAGRLLPGSESDILKTLLRSLDIEL